MTVAMTTRITIKDDKKTRVHVIDMKGLAGAMVGTLALGAFFFIIGFSTPGWYTYHGSYGLWDRHGGSEEVATQVMETLALVTILSSLALSLVYFFIHHAASKNTILISLFTSCYVSGLFVLIGLVVFGVKYSSGVGKLDYSYVLTAIGGAVVFAAGVLCTAQMSLANI